MRPRKYEDPVYIAHMSRRWDRRALRGLNPRTNEPLPRDPGIDVKIGDETVNRPSYWVGLNCNNFIQGNYCAVNPQGKRNGKKAFAKCIPSSGCGYVLIERE